MQTDYAVICIECDQQVEGSDTVETIDGPVCNECIDLVRSEL